MTYVIGTIFAVLILFSAGYQISKFQDSKVKDEVQETILATQEPTEEDKIKDAINAANEFVPRRGTAPKVNATPVATPRTTSQPTVDRIGPVLSAAYIGSITSSGAIITWSTSELADSQIEYGSSASYGNLTTLNTLRSTNHQVNMVNLNSGTTYHFRIRARDAMGNLTLSGDYVFTTTSIQNPNPNTYELPEIDDVSTSNITTDSARIRWITDIEADSQVKYGKTTSYGSLTTIDSNKVTSHTVTLHGLEADTTYHFRVISKTSANTVDTSSDYTFRTDEENTPEDTDNTGPVISSVSVSDVGPNSVTVNWTTNENADAYVEAGTTESYGTNSSETSNTKVHSMTLSGLSPSTSYHYRIRAKDAANNWTLSIDRSFQTSSAADTTPPVMSDFDVSVTSSTMHITWTTDEPATTHLTYDNDAEGLRTHNDNDLVTNHVVDLTGLYPGAAYAVEAYSIDAESNQSTTHSNTYTTSSE